ncbi:hypothetical protein Pan216_12160 [Planctomycetes bacterium Pan216]|uniref:Uncharacterized protein n=1 Tax=Kolteria novifilia TaxID=2527975 RepID=A0A518B066_9BACT|nr:hypothetical protein Pan216_12160 [Planctomycetes bacterium Pan216]
MFHHVDLDLGPGDEHMAPRSLRLLHRDLSQREQLCGQVRVGFAGRYEVALVSTAEGVTLDVNVGSERRQLSPEALRSLLESIAHGDLGTESLPKAA